MHNPYFSCIFFCDNEDVVPEPTRDDDEEDAIPFVILNASLWRLA